MEVIARLLVVRDVTLDVEIVVQVVRALVPEVAIPDARVDVHHLVEDVMDVKDAPMIAVQDVIQDAKAVVEEIVLYLVQKIVYHFA